MAAAQRVMDSGNALFLAHVSVCHGLGGRELLFQDEHILVAVAGCACRRYSTSRMAYLFMACL